MATEETMDLYYQFFVSNNQIHENYRNSLIHIYKNRLIFPFQSVLNRIFELNNEYNQLFQSVGETDCTECGITNPAILFRQYLIEEELDVLQDILEEIKQSN